MPIVEDDPYGLLPEHAPPAFAALAPELTWHISGLAKCLGAGLRVAYVIVPDNRSGWSFAASLRSATVMASPVTVALATRWINDGTGDALLAAVQLELAERQSLARAILRGTEVQGRSGRVSSVAVATGAVDPVRVCRAYADERHRDRCQRRICHRHALTGGGSGLPRRAG